VFIVLIVRFKGEEDSNNITIILKDIIIRKYIEQIKNVVILKNTRLKKEERE
jgi:hypothetical protein